MIFLRKNVASFLICKCNKFILGVRGAGFHRIYDPMLQEGARVEDQSTSIHNFSLLLINKRQLYFFFSIIIYSNDTAPFFAS